MVHKMLAFGALLLVGAAGASAQDYRAEITEQVVDRCYRTTVRYHAMVRAPEHRNDAAEAELVQILKAAPHTERLIAALTETVQGRGARAAANPLRHRVRELLRERRRRPSVRSGCSRSLQGHCR